MFPFLDKLFSFDVIEDVIHLQWQDFSEKALVHFSGEVRWKLSNGRPFRCSGCRIHPFITKLLKAWIVEHWSFPPSFEMSSFCRLFIAIRRKGSSRSWPSSFCYQIGNKEIIPSIRQKERDRWIVVLRFILSQMNMRLSTYISKILKNIFIEKKAELQ